MVEDRSTLKAIAWQQLFPSLRLVTALRMALNFKALVLAAVGLVGMVAGWRVLGQLFAGSDDPQLAAQIELLSTWPWDVPLSGTGGEAPGPEQPVEVTAGKLTSLATWSTDSPLFIAWNNLSWPFREIYRSPRPGLVGFAYLLCCALWGLLVWAFFGGFITRMGAVAFARRENSSFGQSLVFVSPRLQSYFTAPLFPILGTFLMAAFMAALGLAMRTDVGVLVASIVWIFVLLGSFMMAFMLVGLFFGFPLMWGAISAEGTDSFGALSHCYSYVYQRPLHYFVYAMFAAVLGVLGWFVVGLFTDFLLALASWGVSWGSGTARLAEIQGAESAGRMVDTGAAIIRFWTNCIHTLAIGFVFSYFWNASTVIYFLLRRLVDATQLDEVFMPDDPAQHGLPPLKTGPDGVPTVADTPAAGDGDSPAG